MLSKNKSGRKNQELYDFTHVWANIKLKANKRGGEVKKQTKDQF